MSNRLKIFACSGVGAQGGVSTQSVFDDIENAGWQRNETLRKYLGTGKDGGCAEYFLYIFIPDEDLAKYSSVIYTKRKTQIKTYLYVRELFVEHGYGTESELLDIIRSGIESTFGMSVETVLASIRGEKREGIGGEPISTAVASIIVAVITLVTTIISGIIAYAQSVKVAKYTAPTFEELEDSAPAPTDFTKKTKNKGLLYAALAGVGLILFGNFKNN